MTLRGEPDRGRVGIFTTDTELVVRSWDRALAEMTRIPAARAIGLPFEEVVPTARERGMVDFLREPLVSGAPIVLAPALHRYLIPCEPLEPSEEFEWMQQRVVIGALRNDEAAVGVVVTIEDVTARLEAERRFARQLRDANPFERLAAVKQLEASEPGDAEHLAGAIADEDWQVRRAAVRALARTRDAALVGAVVAALREGHRNFSFLSSALQLLTFTGVDLTDALVGLLHDPDADLRIQAALALGSQRTTEAAAALVSALDDSDPNVQFHAIEALGKLATPAAIGRLTSIVASGDFFLSFAAIEALVRIGDPIVAERLTQLLSDSMLASAAADALGRIGDENAIEPLAAALGTNPALTDVLVSAIAAIYRRYDSLFGGAAEIETRVAAAVSTGGAEALLAASARVSGRPLRDLVLVIGCLNSPDVPPALARLLGSAEVNHEVIETLVRLGASTVDLLVAQLEVPAADPRRVAAVALGRIGDRRAVPALVALLREETRETWLPVIGALAGLGDGRAFLPLLALLGDADAGVRQATTGALNSIGHPDMEEHVRGLLESPDAPTRESAVKIAGYFGYTSCWRAFLACCHDEDEGVRSAALEHLPYFDAASALDVLGDAIAHDTPRARAAAAQALAAIAEPQAYALLRRALRDEDAWVRYFAAMSLGRHGEPGSVEDLVRAAASDAPHHVRVAAVEALGAIGGADALAAIEPLAADADQEIGHAAMRILGRLRSPRARAILDEALRSSDARRRLVAIEAMASIGDAADVEALRWTAAADEDSTASDAALAGLTAIGNASSPASQAAVDALIALTADPSRRERAVNALARLAPAAIPWVSGGLKADDFRTRSAVVEALARMLHPSATACLLRALDDEDESVRRQAIAALARIGSRGLAERLSAIAERDASALVRQAAAAVLAQDGRRRGDRSGGV